MVDRAIDNVSKATTSILTSAGDVVLGAAGAVFMPFVQAPEPYIPQGEGFDDEADEESVDPTKKKPSVLRKEFDNRNKQLREGAFLGTLHLPLEYAGKYKTISEALRKENRHLTETKIELDRKVPGALGMNILHIHQNKKEFVQKYCPKKIKNIRDQETRVKKQEEWFKTVIMMYKSITKMEKKVKSLNAQLDAAKEEMPDSRTALQALLEDGADINAVNDDGFTALMLAARNGHEETAKALMEVPKIETNKVNNYGSNAMHYAAMYAHADVVWDLRKVGRVNRKTKNADGNTPKMLAQQEEKELLDAKKRVWGDETYKNGKFKLVNEMGPKDDPDNAIYNAFGIHDPDQVEPEKEWKPDTWRISKIPDPACKRDEPFTEKEYLKRWYKAYKKIM